MFVDQEHLTLTIPIDNMSDGANNNQPPRKDKGKGKETDQQRQEREDEDVAMEVAWREEEEKDAERDEQRLRELLDKAKANARQAEECRREIAELLAHVRLRQLTTDDQVHIANITRGVSPAWDEVPDEPNTEATSDDRATETKTGRVGPSRKKHLRTESTETEDGTEPGRTLVVARESRGGKKIEERWIAWRENRGKSISVVDLVIFS